MARRKRQSFEEEIRQIKEEQIRYMPTRSDEEPLLRWDGRLWSAGEDVTPELGTWEEDAGMHE